MAVYFFDSSAIVKRYLIETGTTWVSSVADLATGNRIYVARIALVEVISAIARRARGLQISATDATKAVADFRHDFANEYSLIDITPTLIESAANLTETRGLRAYDAIQLAAALTLEAELNLTGASLSTLVSADGPLNVAAAAEGLAVDDPNTHP